MEMHTLTIPILLTAANEFAAEESTHWEPTLYGVTDGKAVGTYVEHKFTANLALHYDFAAGNSATGIDLPGLGVDIKVTSIQQPQSSCPFKSARQKVFGLGYNLLVFVYEKRDDPREVKGNLNFRHVVFVESARTGDYQMTTGLRQIVQNNGNTDDIVAFFQDKNLPVDEMEARNIAQQVLQTTPEVGYLTISNALQWRLQYGRAITQAGIVSGVHRVL